MENIKVNGKYGAKIGNIQVFTREGAIRAYKMFAGLFEKYMTMEASAVLYDAAQDMMKIGFTADELEAFEIEVMTAA